MVVAVLWYCGIVNVVVVVAVFVRVVVVLVGF